VRVELIGSQTRWIAVCVRVRVATTIFDKRSRIRALCAAQSVEKLRVTYERMWRDERAEVEATWASAGLVTSASGERSAKRAKEIDRELRRIAKHKAALDVDEARWLREAERLCIWRALGFSSALEYLEDVFGYAPRTAKDRLRVAKELGELPELEAALRDGELPYSAARELTRVMTRATEGQWLARARGKNLRDIEELVAGLKKGASPDDPKDPALMTRRVAFDLDARRDALLQQVRAILEDERGEHLDDAELMEAMCMRVLAASGPAEDAVRAKPQHQIIIRKCDDCRRAWQQGRGKLVPITDKDVARAECDAEVVDEAAIEAAQAAGTRRPKPTTSIPTKTRELVFARDHGRCRFPGCRATRNIDVHHIVLRALGGGHDASNLLLLCGGHHQLLHDGVISIRGRAPDELVFTRDGTQRIDSRAPGEIGACVAVRAVTSAEAASATASTSKRSRFGDVVTFEQAKKALLQLGWTAAGAKRAIEDARAHVGTDADVATLVRAALRAAGRDDGPAAHDPNQNAALAKQALVQLGFPAAVADAAVRAARAHVGTDVSLEDFIKASLRSYQ